jgi:pimeloyl-ACP methyl ester carboxylesterase
MTASTNSASGSGASTITDHERAQIARANASGKRPVVFIHGLFLMPSSWDRWSALFEDAGYIAVSPGWPGDPNTVAEANANPDLVANKGISEIADHFEHVATALHQKPAVIGHSFGGMLAQVVAGRGRASVTVAIDAAPFQGVLPLPFSALKSAWPVLGNPANLKRGVPLTYDQFRYAFANMVSEDEARTLHETYAVPADGRPLFQAAVANFNPWSEAKVDHKNPDRGPMLIIGGENDHTVPVAVTRYEFKIQQQNPGVTEMVEMPGRGHALTIDAGWRDVAGAALAFVKRFV